LRTESWAFWAGKRNGTFIDIEDREKNTGNWNATGGGGALGLIGEGERNWSMNQRAGELTYGMGLWFGKGLGKGLGLICEQRSTTTHIWENRKQKSPTPKKKKHKKQSRPFA